MGNVQKRLTIPILILINLVSEQFTWKSASKSKKLSNSHSRPDLLDGTARVPEAPLTLLDETAREPVAPLFLLIITKGA